MIKLIILAVAVSAVHCQYGGYHKPAEYKEESHDYYAEPHYNFEYAVNDPHTYDIHSQKEERKGDKTQGEYSLVEPDGTLRVVKYTVDGKSGFLAEVHREPSKYKPAPQPSYKHAAEPSYYKQAAEPSYYKQAAEPSYYKQTPEPSYYKPQPSYYKPAPSYH